MMCCTWLYQEPFYKWLYAAPARVLLLKAPSRFYGWLNKGSFQVKVMVLFRTMSSTLKEDSSRVLSEGGSLCDVEWDLHGSI